MENVGSVRARLVDREGPGCATELVPANARMIGPVDVDGVIHGQRFVIGPVSIDDAVHQAVGQRIDLGRRPRLRNAVTRVVAQVGVER